MPRVIDHEQRKLDLMRSAVSAWYDLGFSGSNIGDIARSLGVTRTLFYRYFPDKSSIIDYALDYALEVIGRDYERLGDNVFLSCTEKIYRLFERILTDTVHEKKTMAVLLDILFQRNPELSRQRLRIYHWMYSIRKYLLKILRSGIVRKELKPVKVAPMATTLLMLLVSIMHTLTVSRYPAGRSSMEAVGVLLHGLVPNDVASAGYGNFPPVRGRISGGNN